MNKPTPEPGKLTVLIFGAGAIGTYIGGSLAQVGHRVHFLERREKFSRLRERGFRIDRGDSTYRLPDPHLVPSLQQAVLKTQYHLAVLALKTYHNPRVLRDLQGLEESFPPVLCLQNGLSNEAQFARVLGENQVIPGTVTTSVSKRRTGDVTLEKRRGIGLAGDHHLVPVLKEHFQQAGLAARYYQQPEAMKWSKVLTNIMGNASAAILNMSPQEIYRHPDAYRLEVDQFREALRVMRAEGHRPVNLPGLPVRPLTAVIRRLPPWLSQPILQEAVGGGRGEKMPSFYLDLHSGGKKTEVEKLNGEIARRAQAHGLRAPVNRTLTRILLQLAEGEIPLDTYDHRPGALRSAVENHG